MALLASAAAIILTHNHPSGDPRGIVCRSEQRAADVKSYRWALGNARGAVVNLIVVLIILLLVFGAGGFYVGGPMVGGGLGGLILLILIVMLVSGRR